MVERMTPDSDRSSLNNGMSWSSYTEIIDRKMRYPNSALLALTFDGKLFGSSMPTVTSRWDTWIVKVPSNYPIRSTGPTAGYGTEPGKTPLRPIPPTCSAHS